MTNAEQSKRDYPMIGRLMDAAQAANLSKDEFEVSTFALLALAHSFDHLVGTGEQHRHPLFIEAVLGWQARTLRPTARDPPRS